MVTKHHVGDSPNVRRANWRRRLIVDLILLASVPLLALTCLTLVTVGVAKDDTRIAGLVAAPLAVATVGCWVMAVLIARRRRH